MWHIFQIARYGLFSNAICVEAKFGNQAVVLSHQLIAGVDCGHVEGVENALKTIKIRQC